MSYRDLNGFYSAEIFVVDQNKTFQGIISNTISVRRVQYNLNGATFPLCDVELRYSLPDGTKKISLDRTIFDAGIDLHVDSYLANQSFNGFYGPIMIVDTGIDIHICPKMSSVMIVDGDSITANSYKLQIKKSIEYPFAEIRSNKFFIEKSLTPGIFRQAVRTANANFSIPMNFNLIENGRKIKIKNHTFYDFGLYRGGKIENKLNIENIITFDLAQHIGQTLQPLPNTVVATPSPSDPFIPISRTVTLNGILESGSFNLREQNNFSGIMGSIDVKNNIVDLNGIIWDIARPKFQRSFGGIYSEEIKLFRFSIHSLTAQIRSFNGITQTFLNMKTTSFNSRDLIRLPISYYDLCHIRGSTSFNGLEQDLCHLYLPHAWIRTFSGLLSEEIPITTVIEEVQRVSFNGFYSAYFTVLYRERIEIVDNGLYRDIFVDSEPRPPHVNTPWTPRQNKLMHMSKTSYQVIKFYEIKRAFYIAKSSSLVMTIDFHVDTISNETWRIPPFSITPYMRIDSLNSNDFVIFAMSPEGGSILHMHKTGYAEQLRDNRYAFQQSDERNEPIEDISLDSTVVERSILAVTTMEYRQQAKILKEKLEGVLWDDRYVNEALAYLQNFKEEALFFLIAPYNPVVVRSIILNKQKGLIHHDVFDAPDVKIYETGLVYNKETYTKDMTPFIFVDEDTIPIDNTKPSYITHHKDILLGRDSFQFTIDRGSVVLSQANYPLILHPCSRGTMCANLEMSKMSFSGAIFIVNGVIPRASLDGLKNSIPIPPATIPNVIPSGQIVSFDRKIFRHFATIKFLRSFNGLNSADIDVHITYGTRYEGIMSDIHMHIGLDSFNGITTGGIRMKVGSFTSNFNSLYSDFFIKVHLNYQTSDFDELLSNSLYLTVNEKLRTLEGTTDYSGAEIWLKIFYNHFSGKTEVNAPISDFHITDRAFEKEIFFPFSFVDSEAKSDSGVSKSGSEDIKEKKMIEMDEPDLGQEAVAKKMLNRLCGDYRELTYLDYQNFHHLFREGDNYLFGDVSWTNKKTLMSAYLRINTNTVIRKGTILGEADILRRTLIETKLSAIEDLDIVYNWHIEDFTLESEDFLGTNLSASELEDIDISFRTALKAMLSSLGEEEDQRTESEGVNAYPDFPSRPVPSDDFSKTIKPRQYFVVEKPDV